MRGCDYFFRWFKLHGVPVGGELEYTDEITLMRAFQGRREV